MVARKTPYIPQEERLRPVEDTGNDAYGYRIRSQALNLRDGKLFVTLPRPEHERSERVVLNLSDVLLPPNQLHKSVSKLVDRPELAQIVVATADGYILRQQLTKSTPVTVASLVRSAVLFLEFCWLRDIYSLRDVTPALWSELIASYVEGGWPTCLQVAERAKTVNIAELPLIRRRTARGSIKYSAAALLQQIGTNLTENQIRLVYSRGEAHGTLVRARGDKKLKATSVQQLLTHLNCLADLPKKMRVETLATANPYIFSRKLGAETADRTKNFRPEDIAYLMCESYRWIHTYSGPIVQLLERVNAPLSDFEIDEPDESKLIRLYDSPERKQLEALLGVRVTSVMRIGDRDKGMGLLGLTRILMAACFITLGAFNGRRKDELQAKSIGLYSGAARCLDDALQIFVCDFYCEKSSHEYKQFYVNEISYKATRVLEAISKVAWDVSVRNGGTPPSGRQKKLFCMPPRGSEQTPSWYDYSVDPGIRLLASWASHRTDTYVPNAHMFRRIYAVVFIYRYENADLYALSQQLDHRDFGMTLHYVLEGPARAIAAHAAAIWGDGGENKKARAELAAALADEIRVAADEKLGSEILAIMEGKMPVGGGFGRLIQRFARLMYGKIKYDDRDLKAHARKVTDLLLHRGHTIDPLPHGNCAAGKPRPSAKCFQSGELAKERASPTTCGSCPFHVMRENHVMVIRDLLESKRKLLEMLPAESVRSMAEQRALEATEKLLAFYDRNPVFDSIA